MGSLFGKKQSAHALAEMLENGRERMQAEMKKPRFQNYSGPEVFLDVAVRVQPQNESSYEAKMRVGLLKMYLLKPGVVVRVKYDPRKPEQVEYDDDAPAILDRNPQLKK